MLKQGTAKVLLMPCIVEKAKIKHDWGLILDENAKIRYGLTLFLLKMLK